MTPRLAILSGARAGVVELLPGPVASLGRHPTCHVRLDPDRDTEVSTRHAVVQHKEGGWLVRDLGSAQGTFVNGQRIEGEHALNDGDVLRLGASGPELQFLLSDRAPVAEPSREPAAAQAAKPTMSQEELTRILEEEQAGQLSRRMAAAARKRRLLRMAGGALAAVAVVALALLAWGRQVTRRAAVESHRVELARADSLLASVAALTVHPPAMRASLDSARQAATRLRTALAAARDPAASAPLMAGLDSTVTRERDIGLAAAFNAEAVAGPSRAAVGLVVAQFADGSTALATGFAVRRDGSGGVLLTTRQVAVDAQGGAPVRLAVLLPGVAQPIPARVLGRHLTEDIALLRVDLRGGVPVVRGLGWKEPPVAVGKPVALLGYAPPIDQPADGDWRKATGAAVSVTGSAARVAAGFITVDGWAAPLGAGTPIFDSDGLVAGLISSAAPSLAGRLYDAVPVKFALELLDQLQ
jgi:S1-C subfamily serine protease